jgi:hypothetical protein
MAAIVFLASTSPKALADTPEFVSSAAPFRGRKPLFPRAAQVRSVETALNGDLLGLRADQENPANDACHAGPFSGLVQRPHVRSAVAG